MHKTGIQIYTEVYIFLYYIFNIIHTIRLKKKMYY